MPPTLATAANSKRERQGRGLLRLPNLPRGEAAHYAQTEPSSPLSSYCGLRKPGARRGAGPVPRAEGEAITPRKRAQTRRRTRNKSAAGIHFSSGPYPRQVRTALRNGLAPEKLSAHTPRRTKLRSKQTDVEESARALLSQPQNWGKYHEGSSGSRNRERTGASLARE